MSVDEKKKKDKEKDEDNQLDFVCSYVIKSMRLKVDKWHKMMGCDDLKVNKILLHFKTSYVTNENLKSLFFSQLSRIG